MDPGTPAIRAFGAIEIARESGDARVVSRLRQVLLAMLLAHRDGVVPVATLVETLWPAHPPARVGKSLQVQVHRLRQGLREIAVLRYQPPGYLLAVPGDRVDLYQFEELVRAGRAAMAGGDAAGAEDRLGRALALYRGPAFQGFDDVEDLALESRRLAELRLVATEHRVAAGLALGDHAGMVAELERLGAVHPLRERFRAQLMTALYRSGRKADALAVYRSGRDLMIEELGVEPSEECRALERAILADDPAVAGSRTGDTAARTTPAAAARPVPRQLPADVSGFTGRAAQLRWLDTLLATDGADRPAATVISAVDGMAGVGKTALAVHWAHRVSDRFPDGQIFLDLHGHSTGPPLRTIEALTRILSALGVNGDEIPGDEEAAAARYRSLVADLRLLVVLDNAATADQVRPLLPGGGGCLVLVTGRHQLPGLVARDGARRLVLDVLTPTEAHALLVNLLGADRVAAEPAGAGTLAGLCGHLPLALRVAAASLRAYPPLRIADWVERFRADDGLTALAVPGDPAATVTAALDLSYHRLPPPTRRMFRLVGLAPGPDLTAAAAAALAGIGVPPAAASLVELTAAHLLDERTTGRYRCHDLVRRYAVARAVAEEPGPARTAARSRLFDHYLETTDAAVQLLFPGMLRLPAAYRSDPGPPGPGHRFPEPGAALGWLEAERANLIATVIDTAAHGPWPVAWRLADPVRTFLAHAGHPVDALAVAHAGLAAAKADPHPDPYAAAGAELGLGNVYFQQGRYRLVAAHATRAWRLVRGTDWVDGQGVARYLLGAVCTNLGRGEQAVAHYLAALGRFERIGWRNAQAAVVSNLSVVLYNQGELAEAAAYARRAEAVFAELGSVLSQAGAHADLGNIHHVWGELDRAREHYTRARDLYHAAGSSEAAEGVLGLAVVHLDAGQLGPAREQAHAALATAQETRNRRLEPECWTTLGRIHQRRGEADLAADCFRQAIAVARETGDRGSEAAALIGFAAVRPAPGGYAAARERALQGLAIAREIGYPILAAEALTRAAEAELAAGAVPAAIGHGEQAVERHRELGYRLEEARTHLVLGRAFSAAGDPAASRAHGRRARALFAAVGVAAEADVAAVLPG